MRAKVFTALVLAGSTAQWSSRNFFWSKMVAGSTALVRAKFYLGLIFFILKCLKVRIGFDGEGKITNMDRK
jgi:hypothetical protein